MKRKKNSIFAGAEETAHKTDFEPIPSGSHVARCYSIIDLGTQTWSSITYGMQSKRKIRITWELPNELKVFNEEKGEQPCVISQEFTLSFHEKANLRKTLESWRGKKFTDEELKVFDESNILGKECMLNITHTEKGDKTYANVAGVSPVPKGLDCPEQYNPSVEFSLNIESKDDINVDLFDSLPDFLKEKIQSSPEYQKLFEEKKEEKNDTDDEFADIPEVKHEQKTNIDDVPF